MVEIGEYSEGVRVWRRGGVRTDKGVWRRESGETGEGVREGGSGVS